MNILYIDPGLSSDKGHNAAMLREFAAEFGDRHVMACQPSGDVDPSLLKLDHLQWLPGSIVHGYRHFVPADVLNQERWEAITQIVAEELAPVIDGFDAVLMPTVYPAALAALAAQGECLRGRRVVLGLLLPASFWCADAAAATTLAARMGEDLARLLGCGAEVFAYSETGTYAFGSEPMPVPTLLPPWSATQSALVVRLASAAARPQSPRPLRLGFFGSPFSSKGIELLHRAAHQLKLQGQPTPCELRLRLPQGCEQISASFAQAGDWVDARSTHMDNAQYLAEMAECDVVIASYDPAHYGTKMSGIVPEALALGKPVLLSHGCEALLQFIERYAPGACVAVEYEAQALQQLLLQPPESWQSARDCALAHAPLMQSMKSMDRYLAVTGLQR